VSTVAAKYSAFAALGISTLVKTFKARPFLNLTVYDWLWGYDDNLVRFVNTVLPDFITFERLGLMDRVRS